MFCRYFVDSEVLDRVPSLFLLLGSIWALMQYLSIVFIRDPSSEELQELRKVQRSAKVIATASVNFITAVAYHFCSACLQHSRNLVPGL